MEKKEQGLIKIDDDLYVQKPEGKLDQETKEKVKALLIKLFNMGILFDDTMPDVCRTHFPGFPQNTILGILKSVLPQINEAAVVEAQIKFDGAYRTLIHEGMETAKKGYYEKDGEKMYALTKAAELLDKYTVFMERMGIKPKDPIVIESKESGMSVEKLRNIYEIAEKERKKHDN